MEDAPEFFDSSNRQKLASTHSRNWLPPGTTRELNYYEDEGRNPAKKSAPDSQSSSSNTSESLSDVVIANDKLSLKGSLKTVDGSLSDKEPLSEDEFQPLDDRATRKFSQNLDDFKRTTSHVSDKRKMVNSGAGEGYLLNNLEANAVALNQDEIEDKMRARREKRRTEKIERAEREKQKTERERLKSHQSLNKRSSVAVSESQATINPKHDSSIHNKKALTTSLSTSNLHSQHLKDLLEKVFIIFLTKLVRLSYLAQNIVKLHFTAFS